MHEATQRLTVLPVERTAALAPISDAVWAVTIVDAALVRYHLEAYERVLGAESPTDRPPIEKGLAGLRFVRNQIPDETMLADFIEPDSRAPAVGEVGGPPWIWKSVTRPPLAKPGHRARIWETTRYRGYQKRLVGHPVTEVFERAEQFLHHAAAEAGLISDVGA